jgi:hypothetical protein
MRTDLSAFLHLRTSINYDFNQNFKRASPQRFVKTDRMFHLKISRENKYSKKINFS